MFVDKIITMWGRLNKMKIKKKKRRSMKDIGIMILLSVFICKMSFFTSTNEIFRVSNNQIINKSSEINNVVVFIRFKGEDEFINSSRYSRIVDFYNGSGVSLKSYIDEISYGKTNVNTLFYPFDSKGNCVSYVADNNRDYYKKATTSNLIGYKNEEERVQREQQLLNNSLTSIKGQLDTVKTSLDWNNDNYIDNITFILSGEKDLDEGTLRAHSGKLDRAGIIQNKRVGKYSLYIQGTDSVGIMGTDIRNLGLITKNFMKTLGYPELNTINNPKVTPVGKWDIMSTTLTDPQLPLVYTRLTHGVDAGRSIKSITGSGTYTLNSSNSKNIDDTIAYKIISPLNPSQYFVVEYRKNNDKWDSVLDIEKSGLLIYRVDEGVNYADGNSKGYPYNIYVFRKGTTSPSTANGEINEALISPLDGNTRYGSKVTEKFDSNSLFFQGGTNSCIEITNININNQGNITFNVDIPNKLNNKSLDVNNDGIINIMDLSSVATKYNMRLVEENWNENYDINSDGIIDIFDLVRIAKNIN